MTFFSPSHFFLFLGRLRCHASHSHICTFFSSRPPPFCHRKKQKRDTREKEDKEWHEGRQARHVFHIPLTWWKIFWFLFISLFLPLSHTLASCGAAFFAPSLVTVNDLFFLCGIRLSLPNPSHVVLIVFFLPALTPVELSCAIVLAYTGGKGGGSRL